MSGKVPLIYLDTLVAIADEGSFEGAARQLSRTQSAISQRMRKLEEIVGTKLLVAVGRRRELTRAGETLVNVARQMQALADNALIEVGRISGAEVIRVGAPPEIADTILRDALIKASAEHRNIRVEIHVAKSSDLLEMLRSGLLDVAISARRAPSGHGHLVARLPCRWVASPTYQHDPTKPVPILSTLDPSLFRRIMITSLELAGLPYIERATAPDLAGLRVAVAAGLGVTVRTEEAFGEQVQILGHGHGLPELPNVAYHAYLREALPGRAVRAVLAALSVEEPARDSNTSSFPSTPLGPVDFANIIGIIEP